MSFHFRRARIVAPLFGCSLLLSSAAMAQPAGGVLRPPAPGPFGAIDQAFAGMGRAALGSLSWWLVLFIGLALAYALGLITHTIAFSLGATGAAASRVGAWVTGLLLIPFLIAILPGVWPNWAWWSPYLIVSLIIIGLCLLPKPVYR